MVLQKTSKTILTSDDILKYIDDYEIKQVPHLNDLWEYYKGKNVKIITRKTPDPNNPDNKIVISYGRKIVTTYTGYGYRPKYITYKPNIKKTEEQINSDEVNINDSTTTEPDPVEKVFTNEIQILYNGNNEHIKTNRAGRNLAIFGFSYEILYIDSEIDNINGQLANKAIPKFFTVDPREMILLYDFSPEPKIVAGIRYYKMDNDKQYKVEVYYKDRIEYYVRYQDDESNKWQLMIDHNNSAKMNMYDDIPIVAFYRGDEIQSIIENVLTIIDAYDVLMSDSMNEFDRFAFAYMVFKRISLTSPIDQKNPNKMNEALKDLKRRRVFEGLDKDADVKFLTKDIPTQFITYMADKLKMEIHLQSHVPDFTTLTGALSGAAIDRLLFDFENLVSSDEADFDVALIRRGNLITNLLLKLNRIPLDSDFATMINISHKRNLPLDRNSFAQMAQLLVNGGFSRRMIVSQMPEDMVPDVEAELREEEEEQNAMTGPLDNSMDFGSSDMNNPNPDEQKQIDNLIAGGMNEQDAINQVMGGA
jgi:Phage portal protein, SPP1 Gp6-like.